VEVALRADRLHVVQEDRFTEAGRFRQSHVARDGDREHAAAEVLFRLFGDLFAEIEPRVVHRQQHAFDRERGIEIALHELHGVEQLRETFERVVLALNRDDHAVSGCQHVQREETERRRAVDHDVAVLVADISQGFAHPCFAPALIDELELGANQVLRRGDDVEIREMHVREARLSQRRAVDERFVE